MIKTKELSTYAENTWCPGCGNFSILNSIKAVLRTLHDEGTPLENVVLVSGIGCHAKIVDYINVNSFYSIHGRVTPAAEGIKLANPKLKVVGFAGDGDAYGEGLEHLIFAAKRNIDITMVIHNNRVYGLTTGQYTPTSPRGFRGRSTPAGTLENPINPLELMLASGATFIARGFSSRLDQLKTILKEAITHKGFALVDVLQVCVTFFNMYEYYNKRTYELKDHNATDYDAALKKIREWNYDTDAPIGTGVFFKKDAPTFDEKLRVGFNVEGKEKHRTGASEPKKDGMVKYRCTVCDYVYDPEKGDPDNGIKPGTSFEDLPDGWVCPECGVGKERFEKM